MGNRLDAGMYFKDPFKFEFVIFIIGKEKLNMPLLSTKVIISHWDFPVKMFVLFSYFVFISGIEKIGEGNGTPLEYSCLENPMDRGAW